MQCIYVKSDGERCKVNAMRGDDYCYRHSPNVPDAEKKAASRKGGVGNRARCEIGEFGEIRLDTVQDVLRLLKRVTEAMLNGRIDQRIASTTGYIMSVSLKALEGSELERRVKALEELIKTRENGYN